MTGTAEVRAAGGVVTRVRDGTVEVLLVHRPRYDDWSFPKGKADADEPDDRAALREVEEETGVVADLHAELPTVRYRDHHGRPKRVRYWHMTVRSASEFAPTPEVDEVRWLPIGRAGTLLTYPHDRAVLAALAARAAGSAGDADHAGARPQGARG